MDDLNPHWAWLHALTRDCPGKTFWNATAMHPAIFRALCMDKAEDGAIFAAAAFRLHRSEDGVAILCAMPALRILEDADDDWLNIEAVLAWNPVNDTALVLADTDEALFGHTDSTQPLAIYASPFAYLRHIAEQRAQWFAHRRATNGMWRMAIEPTHIPGLLALNTPDKVRWPMHDMPAEVTTHGLDARAFNSALIRQSHIPRAIPAPEMRKAA
jgi:hypothetical protein